MEDTMENTMENTATIETKNRLENRAAQKLAREQLSRSAAELRKARLVTNPSDEDREKRSANARVLGLAGGALGGVSKSPLKSAASRANGARGGRPRKNPVVE